MKIKPAHEARETSYPEYDDYRSDRRRLLRLLLGGGAALSMGSLLGCDRVRDVLGLTPPPPPLPGVMPPPVHPVPPTGDDDDDSAAVRPDAPVPGQAIAPEPATPAAEPAADSGGPKEGVDHGRPSGRTKGKIKAPSGPKGKK